MSKEREYVELHDGPEQCPTWYDGCNCDQTLRGFLDLVDKHGAFQDVVRQRDRLSNALSQMRDWLRDNLDCQCETGHVCYECGLLDTCKEALAEPEKEPT